MSDQEENQQSPVADEVVPDDDAPQENVDEPEGESVVATEEASAVDSADVTEKPTDASEDPKAVESVNPSEVQGKEETTTVTAESSEIPTSQLLKENLGVMRDGKDIDPGSTTYNKNTAAEQLVSFGIINQDQKIGEEEEEDEEKKKEQEGKELLEPSAEIVESPREDSEIPKEEVSATSPEAPTEKINKEATETTTEEAAESPKEEVEQSSKEDAEEAPKEGVVESPKEDAEEAPKEENETSEKKDPPSESVDEYSEIPTTKVGATTSKDDNQEVDEFQKMVYETDVAHQIINDGTGLEIDPTVTAPKNVQRKSLIKGSNIEQEEATIAEKQTESIACSETMHFDDDNALTALVPVWSFGLNRHIPMINLSTETRKAMLYTCAHLGILYDFESNRQMILQGHSNSISCTAASADKRWIVTGDRGKDSMTIIWDSTTAIPVRSMFDPHEGGVVAVDISPDARYLATLSAPDANGAQIMAVWDWTTGEDRPLASASLQARYGLQNTVAFNSSDTFHLVSNSESQVIFYCWKTGTMEYFAPPLSDKDFHKPVGRFSNSVYIPNSTRALTATSHGLVVVWDSNKPLIKVFHYNPTTERTNIAFEVSQEPTPNKKAVKLVPMHEKAITVIMVLNQYIVTGDTAGHIKFFDHSLMLVYWYQNFNFGPINAISFQYAPYLTSKSRPSTRRTRHGRDDGVDTVDLDKYPDDATIPANKFVVNDFLIGTSNAVFASITVAGTIIKIIQRDHDSPVHALTAHPLAERVATAGFSGLLKIWNYITRKTLVSRYFEKGNQITSITFDPMGIFLACGFANGVVRVLDAETLHDVTETPFHLSRDRVTHVVFSEDSKLMATVDAEYTTTMFEFGDNVVNPWTYIGRVRAHYKEIEDIMFGTHIDTGEPRLLTIGKDRVLVEYDLLELAQDKVPILSSTKIEQSALPLCMTWYPCSNKEQFICTSNSEFKMKLYNSTTAMCRKTILGPTYGSPVKKMMSLPSREDESGSRFIVFHIHDQVGLLKLPLDGNPHKSTTMIAHPTGVSNLSCSFDGKFIFTAGGEDSTVHMWRVCKQVLEAQVQVAGTDITPFYDLLDGGREGELFSQLEDYFYYAQLRSQGIDTMDTRSVSVVIPVAEIPFVMRALGFYPTEQEIEDMLNEVKFSDFIETGEYKLEVNLEDFIRLYINHRPAFGLSLDKIKWAFDVLGVKGRTQTNEEDHFISREDLFDMLQSKGEHMMEYELAEYLTTLLGFNAEGGSCELEEFEPSRAGDLLEAHIPSAITARAFVEDILCLLPGTHEQVPLQTENSNVKMNSRTTGDATSALTGYSATQYSQTTPI